MKSGSTIHRDLIDFDQRAREAALALEMAGKLPPRFVERHYPLTRAETLELNRLKAAAAAATDVPTYLALARGEAVPVSRLNRRIVDQHYARLARGR